MAGFTQQITVAAAVALQAGCLFVFDPVNDRPHAVISVSNDTPAPHHIGSTVTLDAFKSSDDHYAGLTASWAVWECDPGPVNCDRLPDLTRNAVPISEIFEVPVTGHRPLQVQLVVEDSSGARSEPPDTYVIDVSNRPPVIEQLQPFGYRADPAAGFVVTTPVELTAVYSDPDDDEVTLSWDLQPPAGADPDQWVFEPLGEDGYRLIPDVEGSWRVIVTAEDSFGGSDEFDEPIPVAADAPPWIEITDPPATPDSYYSVGLADGPRRFAVLSVVDDLHPYPTPSTDDPFLGQAAFSWRISGPGDGGWQELPDNDAPDLVIDPANYSPGDVLLVQVTVADGVERTLSCADDAWICEINAGSGRPQRVTWGVEIR